MVVGIAIFVASAISIACGYKLGKQSRDESYFNGFVDGVKWMNKKKRGTRKKSGAAGVCTS